MPVQVTNRPLSASPLITSLLIAALAGACYANSLACGFVLDDGAAIADNPAVTTGARIFTSDFRGGSAARGGGGPTSAYRPWVTRAVAGAWWVGDGPACAVH